MPVRFEYLPGEPLIIAHFSGHGTADDVLAMFDATGELLENYSRVYRIANYQRARSSMKDVIDIVRKTASDSRPGSTQDPRVTSVLVADNKWVSLGADLLRQTNFGNIRLEVFNSQAEALKHLRELIQRQTGETGQI